jgi:hypothetical protein
MISEEQIAQIRHLFHAEHWKIGTIASQLGLHPLTVRAALETDRFRSQPRLRDRLVDPFLDFLRQNLQQYPRLRATRLYQMIRPRGYTGSISQLRRVVAELRPTHPEAFLRLNSFPGEMAQADWAHFGEVSIGRAVRRLSAFVLTLCYSRALWLEFFFDQGLENFLLGHVHAFHNWDGAPRTLQYDFVPRNKIIPTFPSHIAQGLKRVLVTADEGLKALTMSELDKEHPAVGFDQAEGVELSFVALIIERAEVAPVDLEALPRAGLHTHKGRSSGGRDAHLPQVVAQDSVTAGIAHRLEALEDDGTWNVGVLLEEFGDHRLEGIQLAGAGTGERQGHGILEILFHRAGTHAEVARDPPHGPVLAAEKPMHFHGVSAYKLEPEARP